MLLVVHEIHKNIDMILELIDLQFIQPKELHWDKVHSLITKDVALIWLPVLVRDRLLLSFLISARTLVNCSIKSVVTNIFLYSSRDNSLSMMS